MSLSVMLLGWKSAASGTPRSCMPDAAPANTYRRR
jgi:hypothetical protein